VQWLEVSFVLLLAPTGMCQSGFREINPTVPLTPRFPRDAAVRCAIGPVLMIVRAYLIVFAVKIPLIATNSRNLRTFSIGSVAFPEVSAEIGQHGQGFGSYFYQHAWFAFIDVVNPALLGKLPHKILTVRPGWS
jgi:hypothetical protein